MVLLAIKHLSAIAGPMPSQRHHAWLAVLAMPPM
jgi:hypothetical protein